MEREMAPIRPSKGYLVFDPALCTGCHVCEAVCSFKKEGAVWPEMSRIQVQMDPFNGTVDNYLPKPCLQCETPQCMLACPVDGAMYVDEKTGARMIDAAACPQGCSACRDACGAYYDPPRILFHPEKRIQVKCDLCAGSPECVKWCPNGAVKYLNRSEFAENGSSYRLDFTEAFEKDIGPTFEPFNGHKWRFRGPWLNRNSVR